jgi:ERCC4-type nuclease
MITEIKVDYREGALYSELQRWRDAQRDPKRCANIVLAEPAELLLGDIYITKRSAHGEAINPDDIPTIVIERKTWPDLTKSLIDGRLMEQSYRAQFADWMPPLRRVYYLFEGPPDRDPDIHYRNERLRAGHELVRGFSSLTTRDVADSALRIWVMAREVQEHDKLHDPDRRLLPTDPLEYVRHVPIDKAANMTPEVVHAAMLAVIPGIGQETAIGLMRTFGTLPALVQALTEHGPEVVTQAKVGRGLTRAHRCSAEIGTLVLQVMQATIDPATLRVTPTDESATTPPPTTTSKRKPTATASKRAKQPKRSNT